jgi:signal transduction histidine kinase
VLAGTQALTDVVDELLVAADPGGASPERGPVDLVGIVTACVAAAAPAASSRGLTLTGASTGPAVASVSETALRRAVTSLIDSALDRASSAVQVEVRTDRRTVQIVVTDDGSSGSQLVLMLPRRQS